MKELNLKEHPSKILMTNDYVSDKERVPAVVAVDSRHESSRQEDNS